MFFFPYATDAPVYYWPLATVSLIAVNVTIWIGMIGGEIQSPEDWILWYGQGLHPAQWVSSIFIHGGPGHLVGNMLFLWVFGLVVEGKLGWAKFLACYLGIGVGQSMLEQLVMLGYNGDVPGSLGASAAIFGLMAMAAVWAPKNEVAFVYWVLIRAGTFEVSILGLAVFYTVLEILFLVLSGGTFGSSWLHLSGIALGLPLGLILLKRKVVDCEGWDVLHVWKGDYGAFKEEDEPQVTDDERAARRQLRDTQQLTDARGQLRAYLQQGNVSAAVRLYEKLHDVGDGLVLDRDQLMAIIKGLQLAGRWADSAPFMVELIDRFPHGAGQVRLKLAQICVVELQRPGKALDLLATVDVSKLSDQQAQLAERIAAKARQLQDEGTVELDTEEW